MSRIGTYELYTDSDGWIEVEVYDTGGEDGPAEVRLANGDWGRMFLTSPAEANTPLELYTDSDGWRGVSRVAHVLIDDFENEQIADAWNLSEDAGISSTSSRAAFQGDYGALFSTDSMSHMVAHPDYSVNLPYYPQAGDVFEGYFRATDGGLDDTDGVFHFSYFGIQDPPAEGTFGWSTEDLGRKYVFNLQRNPPGPRIILQRHDIDRNTVNAEFQMTGGGKLVDGVWYRFEIDWRYTHPDWIVGRLFRDADGNEQPVLGDDGNPIEVWLEDTAHSGGGIGQLGTHETHYDFLRKTAPL